MKLLPLFFVLVCLPARADEGLVERHSRALAVGKLDVFVRYYRAHVRRGVDLMTFFESRSPAEQRQVRAFVKDLDTMPPLRRDGEILVFGTGADEVVVRFPDLRQNQFVIAGVKMAYDPSAAPAWQMRLFKAKLDHAAKSVSMLIQLLLPEANAFITQAGKAAANYGMKVVEKEVVKEVAKEAEKSALKSMIDGKKIAIIASVSSMATSGLVGLVKTSGIDGFCTTVTIYMGVENGVVNYICGDWKVKNVQIAAGTATKQIGYTKELDVTLNWSEEQEFVCPPIAMEGKSQLTALMQATESPNKPVWFKWVGNLEKGEHKTADVYRVDHPERNPEFTYAGTVNFLPTEGIAKDPVRVDIPPDQTDMSSPDSTRSPTPYRSYDAMPVPEMVNYKEAVAARRLISLSNTMKVVAQNCRQARKKATAPAGLKEGISPANISR